MLYVNLEQYPSLSPLYNRKPGDVPFLIFSFVLSNHNFYFLLLVKFFLYFLLSSSLWPISVNGDFIVSFFPYFTCASPSQWKFFPYHSDQYSPIIRIMCLFHSHFLFSIHSLILSTSHSPLIFLVTSLAISVFSGYSSHCFHFSHFQQPFCLTVLWRICAV